MPQYYFHIREGSTLTRDTHGQELADVEAARDEAIALGHALMAERPGGLHRTIEIADGVERGHVVDVVTSHDILLQHRYPGASQPAPANSPRR